MARLLARSAAATLGNALGMARSSEFDVALVNIDFRLAGFASHRIDQFPDLWVAYMDVCAKSGFDNRTCVMKSRLVIHAILNLTGK